MTLNLHEAGILEFLEVMRDGRRSKAEPIAYAGAGWGLLGFSDFLEHFEAAWIRYSFADKCELAGIDLGVARWHVRFIISCKNELWITRRAAVALAA
jgi:hypothetical protein